MRFIIIFIVGLVMGILLTLFGGYQLLPNKELAEVAKYNQLVMENEKLKKDLNYMNQQFGTAETLRKDYQEKMWE